MSSGSITGTVGGIKLDVIVVDSNALVNNTVPDWLDINSCPTVPSSFGRSTIWFASPSCDALPATCVPLTPIVNTGVVTVIASVPTFAICPDTKEKFPDSILAFIEPVVGASGS